MFTRLSCGFLSSFGTPKAKREENLTDRMANDTPTTCGTAGCRPLEEYRDK